MMHLVGRTTGREKRVGTSVCMHSESIIRSVKQKKEQKIKKVKSNKKNKRDFQVQVGSLAGIVDSWDDGDEGRG